MVWEKIKDVLAINIFPWLPSIPLPQVRTGGRKWSHYFIGHMSSYVDAGLSLSDSVDACINDFPRRMKRPLRQIKQTIEEGSTLSEALMCQSRMRFSKAFFVMIETGEISGTLAKVLRILDRQQEDTLTLKRGIIGAVAYHVLVLFIAFVITVYLLIRVLPTFREIFADMKAEFPPSTMLLTDLSERFMSNWPLLIVLAIIAFLALFFLFALRKQVDLFGRIVIRIPVIGGLIRRYELLYFSSLMSLLLETGLTVQEALSLSGTELMYPPIRDASDEVARDIREGKSFAGAIAEHGMFPSTFTWLVSVGEESGSLARSFETLAEFERVRINRTLDIVRRFFQPSALILMSLGIGFIVIALWLPVLNMSSLPL